MCVRVHNDWLCMQTRVQKVFLLDLICACVWASFSNWGSKEVSMATMRMDPCRPYITWVVSLSWELAVPFFHLNARLEENSSGKEVLNIPHRKKEIIHWFSVLSSCNLVTKYKERQHWHHQTLYKEDKSWSRHFDLYHLFISGLDQQDQSNSMTILANLTNVF